MVGALSAPAVQSALQDPELRGQPITVYLYLLPGLRFQEWRPVKVHTIQRSLRMGKRRVISALKRLVDAGYLQRVRDPATLGGGYRYLLVESLPPRGSEMTPAQAA
jgi:predicted transcriptional regulator